MPISNTSKPRSPLKEILDYLINTYRGDLGITRENFAVIFSNQSRIKINKKTVAAWLHGTNKIVRENSAVALAAYFHPFVAGIQPSWFYADSVERFKALQGEASRTTININIDTATGGYDVLRAENDLPGLYHTYRYAFENTGRIAKELLHIRKKEQRIISTFYFRIKGEQNDSDTLRVSEGLVLPIGDSYLIFSLTHKPDRFAEPRVRAFLLKYQGINKQFNIYRAGILLSSSATKKEPCAVRVLLQKESMFIDEKIEDYAQKEVGFLTAKDLELHFKEKYQEVLNIISNDKSGYILGIDTDDVRNQLIDSSAM